MLLLHALLAAALAAGTGHPALALDLAGTPLPLAAALEVESSGGRGEVALAWRTEPGGALVGEGGSPDLDAVVRLDPASGAWRLGVSLAWRRTTALTRASLRLGWPGAAPGAVGRDLAPGPLRAPLRVGRGTPLLAWAGPALLTGGEGVVAARLAPRTGEPGLEVTLFLDDAAERPFATYEQCLTALPHLDGQPGHQWSDLERKHAWTEAPRRAGEVDRLNATLWPRRAGAGPGPLLAGRWPAGARAAVVLTDHADRTEAGALRAVLFGHSDPRAEGAPGAGLLGRGLAITRTFFVSPGPGTLADPETARLASWLVARGSEVGLHSISDGRDDRGAVRAGLAAAAPFAPATWIDHEPYVNCEALSAQGAGGHGPYAVEDLLAEAGLRWGWAAGDVAGFKKVELSDLFAAAPPSQPCPVVYPLPADPRLWIFQTSFFWAPPDVLAAALSGPALDALERGQGLFVGHTYLGAGPGLTHGALAASRLAVQPAPGGGLRLAPALDEAFARVADRARAGRLASLPWSEAGDRLRALGEVELTYLEDGGVEVENHGERALPGLTLSPLGGADGLEWWVDGRPAAGDADGGRIWFDLPAGARRVVRATRLLAPVPLWPAGR